MKKFSRIVVASLAIALVSAGAAAARDAEHLGCEVPPEYASAAFQGPMKFYKGWNRGNSSQSQWIVGVGVIDESTPDRFSEYLSTVENRRQRIVLHSPGGNLLAGLQLGLRIREAGLATQVGRTYKLDMESDYPCRTLEGHVEEGECSSACAYAFLGGVAREISSDFHRTPNSRLGFHQFYGGHDASSLQQLDVETAASETMSTTQILLGYIAAYLHEIEMEPGILQLASMTSPREMYYPTHEEMIDLGIITPADYGPWFMEPHGKGLVAASREYSPLTAAEQITAYCRSTTGDPVLMLTTDFSPKNVQAFLEPFGRPDAVNNPGHTGTLEVDGKRHSIPSEAINVASSGHLVFLRMKIPQNAADAISSAQNLKLTYDAPRYKGYQSGEADLTEMDRKIISLAFRNCI